MKKTIYLLVLSYIKFLAKIQLVKVKLILKLQSKKMTIIGITGSAGKTTTLSAIQAVFESAISTKTSAGANSESGIPLNILDFKITKLSAFDWLKILFLAPLKLLTNWKIYQVYLVEMGVDEPTEPKNMSYLLKIIKPQIAVFLNVNQVHSIYFDKTVPENITGQDRLQKILENIANEKSKLINSLPQNGFAILNIDDPQISRTTMLSTAKKLTISSKSSATLKILKTTSTPSGFSMIFSYQNQHYSLNLKNFALPEITNISLAAAILTGISYGFNIKNIIKNIENFFTLPPSRSNLLAGLKNSTIIDSSYNSSPPACIEMLKLLSTFPSPRIAVLGDMRELGQQSQISHQQIEKEAIKSADLIISVGPETKKYFGDKAQKFTNWWTASKFLKNQIQGGETILVKGSQNTIFLEELVKEIILNPSDSIKLCRQSPFWLKTKSKFKQKTNS